MLIAYIITKDKKGEKSLTVLKDHELYENIKLFNLKTLTGLDRINSLVSIIDLFGKMLTNKILITKLNLYILKKALDLKKVLKSQI